MQIDPQELTFNIIFLPGTVELLRPFTLSLLKHSSRCRFRLVANGCGTEEQQLLDDWCGGDERLDWCLAAGGEALQHGDVISWLHRRERSPYFAFMDSDIFAQGPFLDNLVETAATADAVFSCPPRWGSSCGRVNHASDKILFGRDQYLQDGCCVGNSYFAVYDDRRLRGLMEETGVDFKQHSWRSIGPGIREELRTRNRVKAFYDTGKLLNILLAHRGGRLEFEVFPNLVHIGGVSSAAQRKSRTSLSRAMGRPVPPALLSFYFSARYGKHVGLQEVRLLQAAQERRNSLSEFCLLWMQGLRAGNREEPGDGLDEIVVDRPRLLVEQLRRVFSEGLEPE